MIKKILNFYNKQSVVLRASLAYMVASLFVKGISIITMPIFTRLMSTSEMGVTTTFTSWQSLIGAVAGLALTSGSYAVAMQEFKDRRDQYEASILVLSTLSSLVFGVIYIVSPNYWNSVLELSTPLVALMITGFIFLPATDYWLARQRFEYKYKKAVSISIITSVLSAIVSVIFVYIAKNCEVESLGSVRLYGVYSITLLTGMCFYIIILKKVHFKIDFSFWKNALKINLPLVVHTLSKYILDISDRTMISKMIGKSAVGIYGTLYNLSSLSLIVWNAINNSIVPTMFENMSKGKEAEIKFNKNITLLVIVYGIFAFVLTLLAPEIVLLLTTQEYYEAIYIMPPIAAGIYFTALYNIFGNILIYHKKTVLVMVSTIVAAITNVGLNYIGIMYFGYMAASYTTLICYIILAVMQYILMVKVHGYDPFNTKLIVIVSLLMVVLCMSCLILYKFIIVRYILIVGLLLFCVIRRKRIISIFKSIKRKS